MNLQINLFSEKKLLNKSERRFSLMRRYEFMLSDSIPKDIILDSALNSKDEIYVSSIKYALANERSHSYFLGANLDTHFNLEAMNVSKKSKGFVVVYSINKLLPMVFNLLCGSDIETVSKVDGIDDISDSILNLDFTKDIYVNSLINADSNLDEYLKSFFATDDSDIEQLKRFVSQVNSKALEVIKYIISYLETYSDLVVMSVDKSRMLLSTSNDSAPSLSVSFNGHTYLLNPLITNDINGVINLSSSYNFCEVNA